MGIDRTPEPTTSDDRQLLLQWLDFHRDALAFKCEGLAPHELVTQSVPPSDLSLLGLVRHLTEMERVYAVYALGGGPLVFVHCTDDDPDADISGAVASSAGASMDAWHRERADADRVIAAYADLDAPGLGNGRTVRWNLVKLIQEYARHNGHADLLRESIDGATGE